MLVFNPVCSGRYEVGRALALSLSASASLPRSQPGPLCPTLPPVCARRRSLAVSQPPVASRSPFCIRVARHAAAAAK
ncbi:hypothetical protein FRC06_010645, partial [Ceratobasidium sp. 370]